MDSQIDGESSFKRTISIVCVLERLYHEIYCENECMMDSRV